ncbi:MAG: 3'(2'),5'-bisphosphate nucleotidase CysQ [Pseudonocardiaceae bacterium]
MDPDTVDALHEMMNDAALARAAADAAALTLLRLRRRGRGGEGLGRDGDASANATILRVLLNARPDDATLTEEAVDDLARLSATRVWIIDPLDGTREYAESGRIDWAVHVALWSRRHLVAGAVALPALGITLATDDPPTIPVSVTRRLRVAVSRTRPPSFVSALAERLDAELVPLGSAGYKTAAVIRGEVDAYVHAGGQYEWDSAAPVAVALSSGLHASRLDGAPLVYNSPDPLLPDLLVCRPELADSILRTTAKVLRSEALKQ